MALFRVQWAFSFQRGFGWKETAYWNGPDLQTCFQDAAQTVLPRRRILSSICSLVSVSIAAVPSNGQAELFYSDIGVGPGLNVDTPNPDPEEGISVNIHDTTGRFRRSWMLRGGAVTWGQQAFRGNATRVLTGKDTDLLNGFFRTLGMTSFTPILSPGVAPQGTVSPPIAGAGRWCLLARAKPNGAILDQMRITGFQAVLEDCHIRITVPSGSGLAHGMRVHLSKLTGCKFVGIAGDTQVLAVNDIPPPVGMDTVLLKKAPCCDPSGAYNFKGRLYVIVKNPFAFGRWDPVATVDRKTGLTPFTTRGRRRKSCCT